MAVQLRVTFHHYKVELSDFAVDARMLVVHGANKAIADLANYGIETEEKVAFEVLKEILLRHLNIVKAEIHRRKDLIHSLNVLHSCVQLRINEQNFAYDISVSFNIIESFLATKICLFSPRLHLKLFFHVSKFRVL